LIGSPSGAVDASPSGVTGLDKNVEVGLENQIRFLDGFKNQMTRNLSSKSLFSLKQVSIDKI